MNTGVEHWWDDTDPGGGDRNAGSNNGPRAKFFHPTWTSMGLNPGISGDKPATDCSSRDHMSRCWLDVLMKWRAVFNTKKKNNLQILRK